MFAGNFVLLWIDGFWLLICVYLGYGGYFRLDLLVLMRFRLINWFVLVLGIYRRLLGLEVCDEIFILSFWLCCFGFVYLVVGF